MNIFDSNYYKGKRCLQYPLTKQEIKEFRNKIIVIGAYGITLALIMFGIILPLLK